MIPRIGSVNAKRLIAYCGGVEAVFRQKKSSLTKIPGIGEVLANEIVHQGVLDEAKREVEFIVRHGISAIFYLDPQYPQRLNQCDDGPVVIFMKGSASVNLNQAKVISVVGTRSMTDYGRAACEGIIEGLAQRGHNPIIVSGLAYGVDICAHKASLKHGLHTAAVLGHGLNTIYPSTHRRTALEIVQHGLLVTDFPSKTPFDRKNFIKRNRIIAGLSDATLVVESGDKGGALITADISLSYSRDVLAVPGPVGANLSKGCNALIKMNKAALVETALDIEYHLGWPPPSQVSPPKQTSLFPSLTDDEQVVLNTLRECGQEVIDIISLKSKLPVSRVSSILLSLEFAGLVKCKPGKVYSPS